MTVYVTADLHLGHEKVAALRGYDDVATHDDAILGALTDTLTVNDQLWILGDLTGGGRVAELRAAWQLAAVGCESIHLILGNHDSQHPMHRGAHRPHAHSFDSVSTAARRRFAGREILLSHFPYNGDHTSPDRHSQWRLRDFGVPIVHGHTHATAPLSWSALGTPQVCVSVDAWQMRPVALEQVMTIVNDAQGTR